MAVKESNFQGPFLLGFVAGMTAGAAAVYFLATDRGKDFVDDMNELWEEARPELVKQGVIQDTEASLGESVKTLLIQAFAQKAHELTATKKRIRKPNTQFRGV
ncbi:MAG: hypothetical protein UY13_C0002G0016 [Candidatus Pacebacteria bacterium GW2011_GWB1_47_8]|nr:MAG: hypothetical protein UX28_C0001G0164 [Candidatus Pacebacteria bacterium GW2011_GWA1_46_10]KKU84104.1 MAG: hypothetical protein UY13_C0002G0016 [Candidatus Pacebacteria bacterium GW2011_GWB1_47_8]HCR81528.1 hypothetical protein [Candidatus Paceibacterota bacterium]